MQRGKAWPSLGSMASAPLTGFSHGASGISYSLLKAFARTGDVRYREAALDGIEYERSQFVSSEGNWRDLRTLPNTPDVDDRFMVAWCHGAPGIGLARMHALPFIDDPQARQEIQVALETTSRAAATGVHCLCHGGLGNADLFIEASRRSGDEESRARVRQVGAEILQGSKRHGWVCGTPSGIETPGLMLGLAGIGYGLLRLASPDMVPSVLALEPPSAG